jgi:hypothetical protein
MAGIFTIKRDIGDKNSGANIRQAGQHAPEQSPAYLS